MSGERDLQAEQDHAEFAGWFEAQGYTTGAFESDSMAEAFAGGMQAERDLAAQQPQPAPELAAAMADPDDGYLTPIDVLEQERDQTRERLDVIEERIGNLAAGLKLSASASQPSKKSEIEMSVHRALLALLDPR